jgi:hypothetical protein
MDTQTSVQKRKRADTTPNKHAFKCLIQEESTIIIDTSRHRLPSNIEDLLEDDSNDSNTN